MDEFPEMLRKARQDANLSIRQLKSKMDTGGQKVSITRINFIENERMKPTYTFAYDAAEAMGLRVEEAMKAAFLFRVKWCIDREKAEVRALARPRGLSPEVVERITYLDI